MPDLCRVKLIPEIYFHSPCESSIRIVPIALIRRNELTIRVARIMGYSPVVVDILSMAIAMAMMVVAVILIFPWLGVSDCCGR